MSPDSPFGTVVDVAGENQELGPAFDRQLNEIVKGVQRSVPKPVAELVVYAAEALERRVEVQVGGVDEAEPHRVRTRREGAAE